MLKQVNYGRNEAIEGSHRTLSDAVTMYAIYYSDWSEVLEELSEYYKGPEWQSTRYTVDTPSHVELMQKRNSIVRELQRLSEELRSVGIDVDLCKNIAVDEYFDQFKAA